MNDEILNDTKHDGEGCRIPLDNLEYWGFEDPVFYKKIIENIYRKQLLSNHGFKTSQFEEITLTKLRRYEK